MLFPTVHFAIFFVIVFTVSWLTMRQPRVWRWFMLAASYVFYGWWNWRFVPLIIGSSVVNQAFATAITRARSPGRKRWLLAGGVGANLLVLGAFKYYGFFVTSIANGLRRLGLEASLPLLRFVLPVGISFFTFQAISYVVDVYRGHTEPAKPLDFAVYLAFFPQLVAGPIVRSTELLPQFASPRNPRRIDASRAFTLIVVGLVKKVVIADFLARALVDPVFGVPSAHSAPEVIAAIYGFSVQIYCDFSAYSDIAIGVALLLGFKLPDNFDRPYAARSIQDFWRRWHMSLSRWLRDYLYIPLGGSRGAGLFTYRNLMVTMLLGGLWHGAAWKFVLWGGLHGVWLAGGRWRSERRHRARPETAHWIAPGETPPDHGTPPGPPDHDTATPARPTTTTRPPTTETPWTRARERFITFHLVTLAWIPFRADSLDRVWEIVGRLVTGWGEAAALVTPAALLAIGAGIGIQYVPRGAVVRAQAWFSRLRPVLQGAVLAAILVAIDALGPEGVAAFIYFQF